MKSFIITQDSNGQFPIPQYSDNAQQWFSYNHVGSLDTDDAWIVSGTVDQLDLIAETTLRLVTVSEKQADPVIDTEIADAITDDTELQAARKSLVDTMIKDGLGGKIEPGIQPDPTIDPVVKPVEIKEEHWPEMAEMITEEAAAVLSEYVNKMPKTLGKNTAMSAISVSISSHDAVQEIYKRFNEVFDLDTLTHDIMGPTE